MSNKKIFRHATTLQVVELPEVAENTFDFLGTYISRLNLLGAGWCECKSDPGYRGFAETIPVSSKFQAASVLARHLESFNRPKDWNFADAVTLEIHEELLRLVDRGEGAEFLNQFVAVGGEVLDYDPSLVPAAFFTQLMLGNQPTDAPSIKGNLPVEASALQPHSCGYLLYWSERIVPEGIGGGETEVVSYVPVDPATWQELDKCPSCGGEIEEEVSAGELDTHSADPSLTTAVNEP